MEIVAVVDLIIIPETRKAPLPPKMMFLSNSYLSFSELGTNVLYIEMQQ